MKKVLLFAITIVIMLSFVGCGSSKSGESTSASGGGRPAATAPAQTNESKAVEYDYSQDSIAAQEYSDARKIIYNASVMLDVKDLNAAGDSIVFKAKAMGGYVASSSINEYNCQITVRVPSSKLDEFLKYIDTLGGENKQSSINTDDITDQYTDTSSRVRNLKAQEEQLLGIMQKATTVEDILRVQNELYRVRGEIEQLEGQINMWDKLVEMSTVNICLNKIKEISGKDVSITTITWDEIVKGISNGFNATLNFIIRLFSGIFIVLVSAAPLLPFIAVAVWLIIRYIRKQKKNINK